MASGSQQAVIFLRSSSLAEGPGTLGQAPDGTRGLLFDPSRGVKVFRWVKL
jgi:hypothetical protein